MARRFKTGQDLADHFKEYINQEISVNSDLKGKPNKGIAYMNIPDTCPTWSELHRLGVKVELHRGNKYFVYLV